ncbi:MAG: hypothetical protein L0Y57_08005 [Beijerinckiaceae bacterium]|nr:hypothetical protein [Beijerinckiaceae bacterium]
MGAALTVFEAVPAAAAAGAEAWQAAADTNSLYVLIASLILAAIAFVILMRRRF